MKTIFSVFVLFTAINATAQAPVTVATAEEILAAAFAKAAAGNKNVLLIFHASWCGWCRKMDASLQDAAVKPLMEKSYVVAHLSVYESPTKTHLENEGALQVLTRLGGADKGLPYWYILDKEGKVLSDSQYKPGQNTGCPASVEEVSYFIRTLKKTSSLRDAELEIIKNRFRKMSEESKTGL